MNRGFNYLKGIAITLCLTELISCKSSNRLLSDTSYHTMQTIDMLRDTVIQRDSVIIRLVTKNDTVFVYQRETHDSRHIRIMADSSYICTADTFELNETRTEPKVRSENNRRNIKNIGRQIKVFMILAGAFLICVVARKEKM